MGQIKATVIIDAVTLTGRHNLEHDPISSTCISQTAMFVGCSHFVVSKMFLCKIPYEQGTIAFSGFYSELITRNLFIRRTMSDSPPT